MASNDSVFTDDDGESPDWIEIENTATRALSTGGWFLTDNATNLNKWAFPDLTLNPNERLLVFASAKDRQDPDSTLHTNFKLASEGEYLAIVRPDGLTAEQHFSPSFPLQAQDISYGLQQITSATTLIGPGAAIRYQIPSTGEGDVLEGTNADSWIATEFPDSQWSAGSAAIGYATGSPDAYDLLIETDVEEQMFGEATSVYIRIPFTAPDPSSLSALNLKMKWDDGFVAYLNGNPLPIAEENAPSTDELNYQSGATASHSDSQAVVYDNYDISLNKPSSENQDVNGYLHIKFNPYNKL